MQQLGHCSLIVLFLSLLAPPAALAYLDPGSGSMLLQIVLGGLAGFAVLLKLYWQQLLVMFGLRRAEADTASEPPAVDSEIEIKAPPEQQ